METRRWLLQLTYNSVDATDELWTYLNSFTFSDALDESDTVSVQLIDRTGKWASGWAPQKEDVLIPKIQVQNWSLHETFTKEILCGDFMVDQFSFSGFPDMLNIEAISSPLNTDFKETKRYQTWKEVTITQIGAEIAGRYGLVWWFNGADILIAKMEQSGQTDSDFLKKVAEKYGFAMKIFSNKIIFFSLEKSEADPIKQTIRKTQTRRWSFKNSMLGTYTGAKVSYTSPDAKEPREVMIGVEGRIYFTTEKADSIEDAERIGKNALRSANRKELTFSLTIPPDIRIFAGDNIELKDFGNMDGVYQVGKVVHQISKKDYSMQISGWKIPNIV